MSAPDSAVEQYGEGQRSHRTAYSALKHKFEKVGDRWKPKESKGPRGRHATHRRHVASTARTPTATRSR